MDGYLLVDKPAGVSSFAVVAQVRRIIREETGQKVKIGHTGTLDPFATGLLVLVVGKYTKRASEFSKLGKAYEAELVLGKTSATGDPEGEITEKSDKKPSEDEIRRVLEGFLGEIMQRPHRYSAVKIGGQRAYKLARAGKAVDIEPRKVVVKKLEVVDYDYPKLRLIAEVSSGTYIRTLAEDIGKKLGSGAYLSNLRRNAVGGFGVEGAVKVGELTVGTVENQLRR